MVSRRSSLGNEPDCISHDANVSASFSPISVIACNSVTAAGRPLFVTPIVSSSRCFSCASDSWTEKMAAQQELELKSIFANKVTIVQSVKKTER